MKKLMTMMAAQALMLTVPMAAHADVQADPTVAPAPRVAPVAAPHTTLAPGIRLPLSDARMQTSALDRRIQPVLPLPLRPDFPAVTDNR